MNLFQQNFSLNKTIAILLLFFLCFSLIGEVLLCPKKVRAQVLGTGDVATESTQIIGWTSNIVNWIIEFAKWMKDHVYQAAKLAIQAWDKAWKKLGDTSSIAANFFAKQLLDYITDEIIRWIQGGGKPKFVTDWKGFLKNAAAIDLEQFLNELGLGFLCDPFAYQLQIALAEPRPFWERAECTIWDVIDNIQEFYNDFTKGGWDGWIKITTEPQNNFYGAYMLAWEEKEGRRALALKAKESEAQAGGGFTDAKECLSWILCNDKCLKACQEMQAILREKPEKMWCYEDCCQCSQWKVSTPGKIVGEMTVKALSKDIEWLQNKETWQAYVVAIIDAMIKRLITEGLAAVSSSDVTSEDTEWYGQPVKTTGPSPGSPRPWQPGQVSEEPNEVKAQEKTDVAELIQALDKLKTPAQNLIKEQETNLAIEKQILASLNNTTASLRKIKANCPTELPNWASLSVLSQTPSGGSTVCAISSVSTATTTPTTTAGILLATATTSPTTLCPSPIQENVSSQIQTISAFSYNQSADLSSDFIEQSCSPPAGGKRCHLQQILSSQITAGTMKDRITQLEKEIQSNKDWLAAIDQAKQANQAYLTAMSQWEAKEISDDQFFAARDAAVSASQKAAKSNQDNFIYLIRDTEQLALDTDIAAIKLQETRGQPAQNIQGQEIAPAGNTLYQELYEAQEREKEAANLSSC